MTTNVETDSKRTTRTLRALLKSEHASIVAGLVVFALVFGFFAWQSPVFLKKVNLIRNWLVPASISAVIALGMTAVMASSGIDLSVSAMAGLSALVAASSAAMFDFDPPLMIVMALIAGGLAGALNGFFVAYMGVSPFVVTLSTAFLMRGFQFMVTLVAVDGTYLMLPRDVTQLGSDPNFLIGICIVSAVLLHIFLDRTTHGRFIRATGQNLDVSFLSGIRIRFYTWLTYVLCGVLSAIGGVMLTSYEGMARVGSGESYLVDAFLLPILGQAIFRRFSVVGTLFGALFMYMIINGMFILGTPPEYVRIAKGGLLLVVILATGLQSRYSN